MIKRAGRNLALLVGDAPAATGQLERDGYAVLRGVFDEGGVAAMTEEIDAVFDALPPERGRPDRADG